MAFLNISISPSYVRKQCSEAISDGIPNSTAKAVAVLSSTPSTRTGVLSDRSYRGVVFLECQELKHLVEVILRQANSDFGRERWICGHKGGEGEDDNGRELHGCGFDISGMVAWYCWS